MTDAVTPVEDLLQQLADALDALAVSQQQELNAIVERQHNRVAELADSKAQQVRRVSELDQALRQHPHSNQLKDDPELAAQVAALTQQLTDLKEQNRINERVVQNTLNNIDQLKQAIVSSAKKDSLTYNAKGKIR